MIAACAPCMAGTLKVGATVGFAGAFGYSKVRDRKFKKKLKKKGKKTKSKTKKGGGKKIIKKEY